MSAPERLRVHAVIDSLTSGGAEMLLADFAAGAPAAGLDVSVSYLEQRPTNPGIPRLREAGVEPVLVPFSRLHSAAGLVRMRRHLAAVRPHVVHTHLGYSDWFAGLAAGSLGIPWVSTVHVMAFDMQGAERVKLRLMSRVRRHGAHRVVAVSETARRAYLEAGLDRPGHVVTIHNGVVGSGPAGGGAAVRAELGLAPEDTVVTMVTVLRPGKGHDVAAEAVGRLRERFPRLRLVVLGEGPSRADVERAVAPLGPSAVLTGHRNDVMAVLDATDVLLHPTAVDAFPTALLEAMAARVPVVATAVGGIPEIVEPGVTGELIPAPATAEAVAAALAPLLEAPGRRAAMGQAGRARFEAGFTAERWLQRLRALYEGALAARG